MINKGPLASKKVINWFSSKKSTLCWNDIMLENCDKSLRVCIKGTIILERKRRHCGMDASVFRDVCLYWVATKIKGSFCLRFRFHSNIQCNAP